MKRLAVAPWLSRWGVRLLLMGVLVALNAVSACAADVSAPLKSRFGVSIHQIQDPREWDLIVEAGFGVVRMDLNWERVERVRGRYDWSYYDGMAQSLRAHGLRPLFILDYGNAIYSPQVQIAGHPGEMHPAAPTNEAALAAFTAFASEAVRRFQSMDPIWEIWNEPENDEMWPPHSDTAQFLALATRTCEAMRRVSPSAEIVSPGAAKAPTDQDTRPALLQALLASSLKTCLSGLSVHPYLFVSALDGSARTWGRLRSMTAGVDRQGRAPLQLLSSESGVSTFKGQVSELQQAAYVARMLLLNAASDVALSVWYDWRDDGDDGDNPEHRFGLLRRDFSPKPAWRAMRTLSAELQGMQFLCRASVPGAPLTKLVFGGPTSTRVVAWSSGRGSESTVLNVGRSQALAGATTLLGEPQPIEAADAQRVALALGPQPVYIRLEGLPTDVRASLCPAPGGMANTMTRGASQ